MKPYESYKETKYIGLPKIPYHWCWSRNASIFYEVVDTNHPNLELLSITAKKGVVKQSSTGRKERMSADNSSYKRIDVGDIGYNLMNAFIGAIGTSDFEGIISPAYAVCRFRNVMNNNPRYYHYLYRTPLYMQEFDNKSYGIMIERNRLYFDKFKTIFIPVPPRDEQDKIVRYLDWQLSKINKLIKAKKKLIVLLNQQKQAIINKAVTKGLDDTVKMKDSKTIFSEKIPEHWKTIQLGKIARVILSGLDKKSYEGQRVVLLCNYVDVYKNDNITDSINFMKATASDSECTNLKILKDDVIITKDSESWDDIGVPAYVPNDIENLLCAYHLAILRTEKNILLGEFLYNAFRSQYVQVQHKIKAKGVTRFALGYQPIHDTKLHVPPVQEQQAIIEKIKHDCHIQDAYIESIKKELDILVEYRTSFIFSVVTGKVDVRDIVIPNFESDDDLIEDDEVEDNEDSEEMEEE